MMFERCYGPHIAVSPITNKPLADGRSYHKIPTFLCSLCNIEFNSPVIALQHFWKFHPTSNKHLNELKTVLNGPVKPPTRKNKLQAQKAHPFECTPCGMSFNSPVTLNSHLISPKHAFKVDGVVKKSAPVPDGIDLECKICDAMFNSPISAQQHFSGKKHAMNVEAAGNPKPLVPTGNADLVCTVCDVMFNSPVSAEQHFSGKKHALNVEAAGGPPAPKSVFEENDKNKNAYCNVCNIDLTSHIQLQQHYNGVKHKVAAGIMKKPPDWWTEQQGQLNKQKGPKNDFHQKPQPHQIQNQLHQEPQQHHQETLRCETCNVTVNSQTQLGSHLNSLKHKEKEGRGRGGPNRGRGSRGGGSAGPSGRGGGRGIGSGSSAPGFGRGEHGLGGGRDGLKRTATGPSYDPTRGNKAPKTDGGFSMSQEPIQFEKPLNRGRGRGRGRGRVGNVTNRLQNLAGIGRGQNNQQQQQLSTNNQTPNKGFTSFF